jgi:hypothetical protein
LRAFADRQAPVIEPGPLLSDAEWLPHRYDEVSDCVQFRHLARQDHRAVTFLTDEYLGDDTNRIAVPRASIDKSAISAAPIHFVLHSAYCCSTLVARMFDAEGLSMGLKEPTLLNDIVGFRRRGARPDQVARVLDLSLTLLARPFSPGEAVIVKPSNIVNSLAPAMLALRPEARALQLFAPIEDFLASIARKGLWGRRWVRQALNGQISDDVLCYNFDAAGLLELTDLQVAGLGWLSNHAIFKRNQARFGSDRVRMLDSRTLLDNPERAVSALFRHCGIKLSHQQTREIAGGEAFTVNSKDRSRYSRNDRVRLLAEATESHRDEIRMVEDWVRRLAEDIGVDIEPQQSCDLFDDE